MKPIPIITTNHNFKEIEVNEEYDEKQNKLENKLEVQNGNE